MNFIIEKYLSNFVEIDTSQTKASIFSGIINLKNLKIKKEIFKSINLPYFEMVNGYIGNLLIKLKMPRFYKYPINLEIDKVFIHIRQINIDKKLKEEEIKSMEEFKNRVLKNEEELRQNWENVGKEESNIFQQIINDLQIEIKEVVIHIDDTISYKAVPYTLGIILNKLVIKTAKNDYDVEENITENLLQQKIKYKVINIDNFSIYLDCFDNLGEFNQQKLTKLSSNCDPKKQLNDYYEYCLKEFSLFMKNKNFHQYILYKMELNINIKSNDNYLKTNEPHRVISINLPRLHIRFSLKQIKTIFKAKAYNNLYSLYQNGIAKEYYAKELSEKEKENYIQKYRLFYEEKYFKKKEENIIFPEELIQIEKRLSLETIREMRNIAYISLSNSNEYYKIKKELDDEENKWIGKNTERILELKESLKNIELEISKQNSKDKKKTSKIDEEKIDAALSYLNFNLKINFKLQDTKFIVYELTKRNTNKDKLWNYEDILIKFIFTNFEINGEFCDSSLKLETSLEDTIISHGLSKNPNYQNLLFGETSIKSGKVLKIIFEKNPKLEKSDYKLDLTFEKTMHLLYDNHIFSYIINRMMSILNTTINFEEINTYAVEGSVNEYIQQGYADYFFENFQHFNIELNINLLSPIILLPLDPFDINNNKCILLSLGKLEIKSDLPPRQKKDIKYKEIKDENLLYDAYIVKLIGTKFSTIDDCTAVNKCEDYRSYETKVIRDFNLHVVCKKLIEIKNPHFDNLVCELSVSNVEMKLDEFQILFLIDYLGHFMKDDKMIFKEKEIDKLLNEEYLDEENILEEFINKGNTRKSFSNEKIFEVNEFKEASEEDNVSSELSEVKKEVTEDKEANKKDKDNLSRKVSEKKERKSQKSEENESKIIKNILDLKTVDTELEGGKKVDAYQRIREIKNSKKQMRIHLVITKMTLSIKKIHPDLKCENFLTLVQKAFEIDCYMMNNGDMLTLLRMNNISLYDYDIDENKYPYVDQSFQCLINSDQNESIDDEIGFIDMTNLYRSFGVAKEIETIFDMNNLNIIISFDSLLRIYQFMMYYYEKYNEKMYEISHQEAKKVNIKFSEKEAISNKILSKRFTLSKSLFDRKMSVTTPGKRKSQLKKTTIIKKDMAGIKKEEYNSEINIVYNMKNTIFKVPLNPKNYGTPIIFFNFNLIYNQYMKTVYTNYLKMPKNLLIERIYKVQDAKMNILISKVYLDIIFLLQEQSKFISKNEKLISNFRVSYLSSSFLSINSKQSITNSDINIEPLFCKFGVRQIGKLIDFYKKVNSFWFDFCNIKYIPYMKPEYLVDGKPVRKLRKKKNFRDCVLGIMIAMDLRKGIKYRLTKIKEKYNIKEVKKDNISGFNEHSEMKIKFNKIIMTFYDNMTAERTLLLNVNICQMFMKFIWNSKVKDKENIINMVYEMITCDELPLDKYNKDTLAQFMSVNFGFEINYFNMSLNEFEPLMEKMKLEYYMMQICSFSRKKHNANINEMINFNISSNAIKVVNLFLLRYYKKENDILIKNKLVRVSDIKKSRLVRNTVRISNDEIDQNKEVYLVVVNYTELNLCINLESNPGEKYRLNPKGTLTFYKHDIFSEKKKSNSTKLDAIIDDQSKIKSIDFSKNNTRQYKLRINQKNKDYDIYISVKVNTSGLLKQVHFCPSVTIFNDTNFKEIEIRIKNQRVKYNSIIVKQNDKSFIPLTWFLCEDNMSGIYMKINNHSEPIKLYDHISQIIVDPLSDEEKAERKSKKKKLERATKKDKNKYWNQNEMKALINECDNRKDNKIVCFTEDDQKIFFSIDYYIIQSKEIPEILEKKEKEREIKIINFDDTMTTIEESSNDFWYEYLVYIRPFASFYNQLPMNLVFTHGNSKEKVLTPFKNTLIYNDLREETQQIRIRFDYKGDKYRSQYFDITHINSVELINNDNKEKDNLFCSILKNKKRIDFNKNFNFDVKLVEFSTSSYDYIFFFKYLIMNKLSNTLWAKCFKKKKSKEDKIVETELKSGELTIMTQNNSSDAKYVIREENSKWSEPFDLRTISKKGTIEIDTELEKEQKKIINTKDISCILSWGKNYENSKILIFQEQFLIHNKLDFDIYYRQEKDQEKTNHFLKKGALESINRVKEKKIFRLGLFDSNCGEFNYSSPFDIGILKAFDLLIKINEQEKNQYDEHFLYTNDNKNYYILIRIEGYVFDDGLVYLTITNPYFPSFKIENDTDLPVKIYEANSDDKPLIVNGKISKKGFPFVWKNNCKEKNELILEIAGNKKTFSFLNLENFEKEIFEIEIEEDSYESKSKSTSNHGLNGTSDISSIRRIPKNIVISVSTKNKGLTRCLNIFEKGLVKSKLKDKKVEFVKLFSRDKRKNSNSTSFNLKIKGIGFSIINESLIEFFYISLYMIEFKYISNQINSNDNNMNDTTENFEFYLNNFQIDYCLNDSVKYIIAPKKQLIPSFSENIENIIKKDPEKNSTDKKIVPFISLLVTRKHIIYTDTMEESTVYRQIDFIIQEFFCKIEQYILTNLLNIINEFMQLLDYSKKLENESNNQDTILLQEKTSERIEKFKKSQKISKVLINYLLLSSIKFYLTIRLNLNELATGTFPNIFARIFGTIGNTFARFTDVPIYFTEKGIENIYISLSEIMNIIYTEYKRKATSQILKLIGSSDIIGNPVKLLEGIGTGFYELVNEPRKQFVNGPLQFGKGIARGLGKLLSGIIGGAFGVVESISGTLYSSLRNLTWKTKENVLDEDEDPSNIATGAVEGLYGGFKELKDGITGVVLHPMNETKKYGVKGFFKGLGKGLIGLAISPFSAALKFLHSLAVGTKNTVNFIFGNKKVKIKRFRYPRVHGNGEPIKSYDYIKAFAKSEILKIMKIEKNIEYAELFMCENNGFNKSHCLFVKMNKIILIIYRSKIVFEEHLKNIKSCEIYWDKKFFTVKLTLKKGNNKGFRVNIDNSEFVCKVFDLLQNLKNKEEKVQKNIRNSLNSLEENNEIKDFESIETILEKHIKDINSEKNGENNLNKEFERITVNDIKTELENSENENNEDKWKKRDIVINNIFINYNKNINLKKSISKFKSEINKNKSNHNDTIINNESVYSSIKEGSDNNNKDKNSFKAKKVNLKDSLNNSSLRYSSNDNFIHHLIFSDSSGSSSSNK